MSIPGGCGTGVLVVNVGTPEAPTTSDVRRYLAEFLSDPRVIDIPAPARWLLLHGAILRTRPAKSAEAYRKVWRADGSPLMAHSRAFVAALQGELGPEFRVALGMRYGKPALAEAIEGLLAAGVERVVVFPQYPHETASSTGTALERVFEVASQRWLVPPLSVVAPFHADEGFLGATAEVGRPAIEGARPDHVLFSFHGLPERHVRKADETGKCLASSECCASLQDWNRRCYRAQCHATARAVAARWGLGSSWSVSFQSRLGRTPWIRPHTDVVLRELAARGVRRVVVSCAGFVADCLETLEEIGIRGRADFLAHGGEGLTLLPCLNARPAWVGAAAGLVRRAAGVSATEG